MSSTFKVEVVKLGPVGKHPNADMLGIVHVWGYQLIVKLDDWHEGDLAAYVPPDSVVPDTEEFAWLGGHRRITVKRLRGLYSMGLLLPAPEGSKEGDDVAEQLGIVHYEPPLKSFRGAYTAGDAESPPVGFKPHYDVEHLLRYDTLFRPGEPIIATEKIHGANGRWTYQDDRFWAGSRNQWKSYSDEKPSIWWKVLLRDEVFMAFLREHAGYTLYGEVFGSVQDLHYGVPAGEIAVRFFDLWNENETKWVEHDEARHITQFPDNLWVPELYRGPFDTQALTDLATGPSLIEGADHYREGVVVKAVPERYVYDLGGGRLQLKLINPEYYEKAAKLGLAPSGSLPEAV